MPKKKRRRSAKTKVETKPRKQRIKTAAVVTPQTEPTSAAIEKVLAGLEAKSRSIDAKQNVFNEARALMDSSANRIRQVRKLLAEQQPESKRMQELGIPDVYDVLSDLTRQILVLTTALAPQPQTRQEPIDLHRVIGISEPKRRRQPGPTKDEGEPSKPKTIRAGDINPTAAKIIKAAFPAGTPATTLEEALALTYGPYWKSTQVYSVAARGRISLELDLTREKSWIRGIISAAAKKLQMADNRGKLDQEPPVLASVYHHLVGTNYKIVEVVNRIKFDWKVPVEF